MEGFSMRTGNPLVQLTRLGQSVWIDAISRGMLRAELRRLIEQDALRGLTSNPAIFEKAIAADEAYKPALRALAHEDGLDPESVYERLAFEDIGAAADQLLSVHRATQGRDGFASIEVAPAHALDTAATIRHGTRIWAAIARPNVMIKVPATSQGLPAIAALTAAGINVNVTLLFSVETYAQVAAAYRQGLEMRLRRGESLRGIASVGSFFVSRIDGVVDAELEKRARTATAAARQELLALRGRTAIANAKNAYQRYHALHADAGWRELEAHGASRQRLLWASTSTKNPTYRDTLYVDELIGPETVNTMPPATLAAFRDHGEPRLTLENGVEEAQQTLRSVAAAGIELDTVTAKLLDDGVRSFAEAYDRLLASVTKARTVAA
jgi:transaldolase/glucose-6-phosphate isomerase